MNRLKDGDYVPDGLGGVQHLTGQESLLARALFCLTCRRGAFPLLPELGSRLCLLGREKPAARTMAARQYAQEALEPLGLTVHAAQTRSLADGTLAVSLQVVSAGETMELEVVV